MIKNSTLYVLCLAVVLGAVAYYFDWRKGAQGTSTDTSKLAFSVQALDVNSLTVAHPLSGDPPVVMSKSGDAWQISKPVVTGADFSSAQGIVDGIVGARVDQTESAAPDRLKAFGLDRPAVTLDFQTQGGAKHSIAFGKPDFSGNSVYAILDGAQSVSLLPKSILTSVDKSLDEFRDHSVIAMKATDVTALEIKNQKADITLVKDASGWKFVKPENFQADDDAVSAFLGSLETAKMTAVLSETPDDLLKYGLANPAVTIVADTGKGSKSTLLIGKKDGADYDARDLSRPQVFKINEDLFKKFSVTPADWRDKKIARVDQNQINRIDFHGSDGEVILSRKDSVEGEWTLDSPADQKGKSAAVYKIFGPLENMRAADIIDHPTAAILASLNKPATQIELTDKSGKVLTIQISKDSGGFVYVQTSAAATVFKLKNDSVQDLNLKPQDLVI